MGIFVWEENSNSRLSCLIRGLQTLENNKNVEATPLSFHYFVVFETLKRVFELLHNEVIFGWLDWEKLTECKGHESKNI